MHKFNCSLFWRISFALLFFSNQCFSQGFINYQAFIYQDVTVVQPGLDAKQTLPYAGKKIKVFVELRTIDSLIFNETHDSVTTDEHGMVNLRIGSKKLDDFRAIPWMNLSYDSVILKISWSPQNQPAFKYKIDSSILAVSPFSIKAHFTKFSENSFLADSSIKSNFSDTAAFSRNSFSGINYDSIGQRLVFPRYNGDTIRSISLAKIDRPNIFASRAGNVCKGDTVILKSGPIPDTSLFKSFWLGGVRRDTLEVDVSSLKLVLSRDTMIYYRIQRKIPVVGLTNYIEDSILLRTNNFDAIIDSVSKHFTTFNYCPNQSVPLPPSYNGLGSWRSLNTRIAKIDTFGPDTIKFYAAGYATVGFFPYNACPGEAFIFTCLVTDPTAGTLIGNPNVCAGSTTTFSSTVTGGSWSSSNILKANVDPFTGVVTGVAAGSATITYTVIGTGGCANATATRTVTVTAPPPTAGTLSGTQAVCAGSTTTFTSTVSGGSWSSSAAGVATVNASTGVVTGVAAGTATITYTVTGTGGCVNATATRTVTVTAPATAGTLSGTQAICAGSTTTFASTVTGGSWSSSAAGVATVNASTGVVTGVAAGTATITYTVTGTGGCVNNATATRTVTVTAPATAGTLSGTQAICAGSTTTFSSTVTGGSWSTSNVGVATVNASTGLVTGVSAGTATITYTVTGTGGCANATATTTVTVTAPATAGTLSGTQAICAGSTTTFTSTVTGGSWSSSAAGVATVNASTGVVTGVAAGTATITYTVTGTGGCANAVDSLSITVVLCSSSPTLVAGTIDQNLTINTAINNITYSTTGANSATVSGLPAGVTGVWANNLLTISGTPTVTGTFNYTVTMTEYITGKTKTTTGSITVVNRNANE